MKTYKLNRKSSCEYASIFNGFDLNILNILNKSWNFHLIEKLAGNRCDWNFLLFQTIILNYPLNHRVPGQALVNQQRTWSMIAITRSHLGLPSVGPTFKCPNQLTSFSIFLVKRFSNFSPFVVESISYYRSPWWSHLTPSAHAFITIYRHTFQSNESNVTRRHNFLPIQFSTSILAQLPFKLASGRDQY